MLYDLVLDTNVMLHADNPIEVRSEDSKKLLNIILNGTVKLCVDEGFDIDHSKNRSLIGGEYLDHLQHGSLGFAVISILAGNGRVDEVTRSVPSNINRKIMQLVWDPKDRKFIKVCYNSVEKVLVSHNIVHFPVLKRPIIQDEIIVRIMEACDCCCELQ